jgi:hypothetical protein
MNDCQYSLRIELPDLQPLIWRRVVVPGSIMLPALSEVLLAAMGWLNYHLHEFIMDDAHYGVLDPMWNDPKEALIDEVGVSLAQMLREKREFTYIHDFGDYWELRVVVEQVSSVTAIEAAAICAAGERAGPPQDVGGPPGYLNFLHALADPAHDMHTDYKRWIGGSFDAEAFDLAEANDRVKGVPMDRGLH